MRKKYAYDLRSLWTWPATPLVFKLATMCIWSVALVSALPEEGSSLESATYNFDNLQSAYGSVVSDGESKGEQESLLYGFDFTPFDDSILGKRQNQEQIVLRNNEVARANLSVGDRRIFILESDQMSSPRSSAVLTVPRGTTTSDAEAEDHIYITLSICQLPTGSASSSIGSVLNLTLHIMPLESCDQEADLSGMVPLIVTEEGFGNISTPKPQSGGICIIVTAPEAPGFQGSYSFELAASVDDFYANYHDFPSLYVLDTDSGAGLFTTANLTLSGSESYSSWMNSGAPFSIFIHGQADAGLAGLMHSYCAINRTARIGGNINGSSNEPVQTWMTNTSLFSQNFTARQQFYVSDLNTETSYYAFLALQTNYSSTDSEMPGAGGSLWRAVEFQTKTSDNCRLMYNLTFCSTVAYSVPTNISYSFEQLAAKYDNHSKSYWQNFSDSLKQISCEAEPSAQYSLATDCKNCTAAYLNWLCAVTIPRCTDHGLNDEFLQVRNNSSRVAFIDQEIQPGRYNEILPCGSLCHGLVQACPASLGFSCPSEDARGGFKHSYGKQGGTSGNPSCNLPSTPYVENASSRLAFSQSARFVVVLLLILCILPSS